MNELSIFWLIAAVVLGLIETATFGLVCIWFCIGAVIASIVSVFTENMAVQIGVFIITSAILFLCTRRFVNRFLNKEKVATNADSIIGQKGIVTEKIDPALNTGRIKVKGQSWAVKSDVPMEKGEFAVVKGIEGVRAVIEKEE